MEFNDKEKASLVKQEILQALHDENKRLGLYDDVYAVETLEQENRLLRARNDRLEKELAMYQVQRLGQEIQPEQEYGVVAGIGKGVEIPAGVKYYYIEPKLPPQPERDYERGFIDGMQKQAQSSVDKAVNRLAQPEDKKCENCGEFGECCQLARGEQEPVANVVLRDGLPTLLANNQIKPTDERLYTTPPQRTWVGLTDEDWKEIFLTTNAHTLPKAIEAKLKEKNI